MYDHERSLVKRYQNRPFVMLGVNTDKDAAALKRAQEKRDLPWRSFADGPPGGPIVTEWGIDGFPTLFLIDAQGNIRNSHVGPPPAEELDGEIEALVREAEK
jgi:hypothetical protein